MMTINLIEYFKERVALYPQRIAVVDGDNSIDFATLSKRVIEFSNHIVDNCNCTNNPIAVYLPKSIGAVIADLAITYSGNAYMNLDVKTPAERIGNIITTVAPRAIVTTNKLYESIKQVVTSDIKVFYIDESFAPSEAGEERLLARLSQLIDTDPYCIINTSGSTGTPKGVVLNHRSFIDFTEWSILALKIGDQEIIGSLSPLVFDIYSHELCMMMSKGSTIVLLPEHLSAFPVKILEILVRQKVSYIFWVPTIMVNIANMDLLSKIELPALKTIWFAGEVFPTKQFNCWRKYLPTTKFVNLYGPIEITLDCTYYIVEREIPDNEPIPIGFPCRNTDVLILNEKNEKTKQGEEGELCVRGTSLAMGYYNNPEKTAAAFVQNPLNHSYPEIIYRTGDLVFVNERGEIIFKGRKDSLIKHMGYRIELGEIEHIIINTLKLVKNGCIVYNNRDKEIILFYEAEKELPPAEFRIAIGKALPKYMIPMRYHHLNELKRNTNGKIDRLFYTQQINS